MSDLEKYTMTDEEAEKITIKPPKPWPIHFNLMDHKFIEAMEIPDSDYINIKIHGEWQRIDLPVCENEVTCES